jgi:dienelactone hydrolase
MEVRYGNKDEFIATLYKANVEKGPGILVIHAWRGKDPFAEKRAEELSKKGYSAIAVDLYGGGTRAKDNQEAESLMAPLFCNRNELRHRLKLAFDKLSSFPFVDKARIGAMGFCFGGLSVLELLRSGQEVKAAISVHGLFGDKVGPHVAKKEEPHYRKGTELLLLHGASDPLVPPSDVRAIQEELDHHEVKWEMDIYGGTMHAFTNPEAKEKGSGLLYNPRAAARANKRIEDFFTETLK